MRNRLYSFLLVWFSCTLSCILCATGLFGQSKAGDPDLPVFGAGDGPTPASTLSTTDRGLNFEVFGISYDTALESKGYIYHAPSSLSESPGILKEFAAAQRFTDGYMPTGGLILHNEYLWGVTEQGGTDDLGVIF
mgnify:CR=1 FL=1